MDGEPLRHAAQPAVPATAGDGPPDFSIHGVGTERKKKLSKIALLVLDGLAFDQWLLLRRSLEGCDQSWRFQESTAFAWVPTLTSVTRQSIFAGEPPLYFPESIETTSKERQHWLRFWEDQGVQRTHVDLVTSLDGPNDPKLETALGNARLSVLGIVWNKVDDIMHGMQMQTAGMHNQVKLWASQGHLQELLLRLEQERLRRLPDRRPRQRSGHRRRQSERGCSGRHKGQASSSLRPTGIP